MSIEISDITKEQAEVLKLLAEARKFDQEADAAAATAEWNRAQARHQANLAAKEAFYVDNARISNAVTQRNEKLSLSASHYFHEFEFVAGVHEDSVAACLAQMHIWHRDDPNCPMHIIIDSPGGSVIDGMHLFDQIRAYSQRPWDSRDLPKGTHPTTMTVRGYAASMGGILLQAADRRVIGPESYLMIHEVATWCRGKIGEIKDEVKFLDKMSQRVIDIFVGRSNGKISEEEFKKHWDRQDWWLTSEEALKYGFVDAIG